MGQWDERDTPGAGPSGNGGAWQSRESMGTTGSPDVDEALDRARAEMDRYVGMAADFIRERPVAAVAGAIAIGFVVGRLASRR